MFWHQRQWLSMTILLAMVFAMHPGGAFSAQALTKCGSQAKVAGKLNFASKVETHRVLICADWVQRKVAKSKADQTSTQKPPAAKTPPRKPNQQTKRPAQSNVSLIRYSHSASAAPSLPRISASSLNPEIGTTISIRALTMAHSRYRYLLGIPAEVRFTPVSYVWRLGDSSRSTSKSLTHSYQTSGFKQLRLSVKFSVAFRFAGSKYWRKLDKAIWQAAKPIAIRVGAKASKQVSARFVFYDCLEQPRARGCLG